MKALLYQAPGVLEFKDVAEPSETTVLHVEYSGICGTDVKTFLKGHPMFIPPTILGHECIAKTKSGQYVAIAPYADCGSCANCRKGLPELCENKTFTASGCFCEWVGMSENHAKNALFPLPDASTDTQGIASEVFALSEPLACVFNGLQKIKKPYGNCLIVGGGPMGTLFATVLQSKDNPYAILEINPWRREFLLSKKFTLVEEIADRTYDTMIMAASTPETAEKALPLLRDGGSMLLFAGFPSNTRLSLLAFPIHYREISISGSFGFGITHFRDAIHELDTHRPLYGRIISHILPFDQSMEAFRLAVKGECMKILLRM